MKPGSSVLKNSIGIFISRILTTVVAFISIPIIVQKLGIEGYGVWESIIAISVISNVFQGSISGVLLWLVSNAYGINDIKQVRNYVSMSVFVSLVLFLIITPAAWFGKSFLVKLFNIPTELIPTAAWILPCIVGLMLLGTIPEILASLLSGYQRAGATILTQSIAVATNNIIVIFCLMSGFGFLSLLIGFAAGFLISTVGLYLIAIRTVGKFTLMPKIPSRAVINKVAPYAGFMLIGALSIALRDQADKIILSSVASPVWTGYYGIAARLAGVVTIVCTFFYVPTIAAAGSLFSKNDHDGILMLYDDVITMISFVVGLVVVIVGGLYDRIIFLWIGKLFPDMGLILFLLLLGNGVAVILTGAASSVCKGMGLVRIETIYIIISLVLNIILKLTFVPLFGAIGSIASTAVSWSVSSVCFVYLLHKQTDIPLASSVKAFKTLLIIAFCVCMARYFTFLVPIESDKYAVFLSSFGFGTVLSLMFTLLMFWSKVLPKKTLQKYGQLIMDKTLRRFVRV